MDTTGWRTVGGRIYTYRVPATYEDVEKEGTDSALGGWSGPEGQVIDSDYGMWTGRFEPGRNGNRDFVVCSPGDTTASPQIVTYRTSDGAYGAGLHWPVPGSPTRPFGNRTQRATLWLNAISSRREDLPTLLAIMYSVHVEPYGDSAAPGGHRSRKAAL